MEVFFKLIYITLTYTQKIYDLISTFVHVEGHAILLLASKQRYNAYVHICNFMVMGKNYHNLFSRSETV